MSYEKQQKEIETIKERTITVKLSDADCEKLARQCGKHGLTVGELLENFIGDLVGGTYSNGSDERDLADQWFERCWFGMFPEPTLLNHLLEHGYDPENYLDTIDDIEHMKECIKRTEKCIAEPGDEWKDIIYYEDDVEGTGYVKKPRYNNVEEYLVDEREYLEECKEDLGYLENELKNMREDWKPEKEPNMEKELELIRKWVKEKDAFVNAEK